MLEESRTTTIAGNKAITAAPAQDGLTIIIFDSAKGYARTVPNGINNKGWLYLGFLTGAKLKISGLSSSESIFACIGTSTMMPTACYASIRFSNFCVYQVDINNSGMAMVRAKKVGALSIIF